MLSIDKYAYSNRILTWRPQIKGLIWLLGIVLAFQPILWIKGALIVVAVGHTLYAAHLSVHQYLKWFYAILPFILLSIIGIIFTMSTNKQIIYYPIRLFGYYFGVSKTMLPVGLHLGVQVFAAVVCTYWFALTTPFQQIIITLKSCHLPNLMIEEIMLMYRFIFIFIEAFEQIYRAQKLRFGYKNFRLSLHSSAILAKMLFEQVMVNYEHMVHALDAKLYDGEFKV
ncbi:cobalt ECF transporter T component CbiQ [Lentilactobacillus diolivorans]|uniref:cobalt ECF transporter T component CbiQ n=1 Tax=Lentilactobacillus diolivorans TaxID=179838 RepID=UPI00246913A3|nr:cobalt ECF transporter T component CbiQ [Lentilactobacillus diolivorans]MDH5105158.1 cobalt ECF transporter T component CbiQ [Lentilactobacillus diolivorans]